jgi:hypothetical protein
MYWCLFGGEQKKARARIKNVTLRLNYDGELGDLFIFSPFLKTKL